MHIGIFVIMAGRGAGGPETYDHSLVRQLAQLDQETEYTIFCFNQRAANSFRVNQPNFHYRLLPGLVRPISMTLGLPWAMTNSGIDLMHATLMPPPWSPKRYVFTLHCSSMFMHPEQIPPMIRWRLQALVYAGVHQAKHVFCVSQNVLDLTAEHYKIPRDRMSVLYNGVGEHFRPFDSTERAPYLKRWGIHGKYLLFAGRFEQRKNVPRILEAFHIYRNEIDKDVKLVLAGNKTWAKTEVESTIERLGLAPYLILPGHIANEHLPALYSGAEMLVFPSLWEGFGLPVLEAMACGTPVLTSNLSSLPEIAGGAAVLVDPYSMSSIVDGMKRIAEDESLRAQLRAAGFERVRYFTWQANAQRTLQVYRQFAGGR